jgi:hypothetical protein
VHGRVRPAGSWGGSALAGELVRDCARAQALARVEAKDLAHDLRLERVGHDLALRREGVAEGRPCPIPVALLRPPLDPGRDAVDDRGVLELGEDGEHLQHHPPRRRAGIEGLGRGAKDAARGVELLRDLGQLAHLAAEAVDPVDEQEVDLARAGEPERHREAGAVELGAGGAVLFVGDDAPVLLHLAEGLQRSRCVASEVGWFSSSVEMRV